VELGGGVTVTHELEHISDEDLDAELEALEAEERAAAIDMHERDGVFGVEE
jgi:hypothetical protein